MEQQICIWICICIRICICILHWYFLDITWDDQGSIIYYDFFLSGTNTVCSKGFGGNAFNISHVSDGSPYLPVLSYAENKYSQSNHNTAFKATYNSLENVTKRTQKSHEKTIEKK